MVEETVPPRTWCVVPGGVSAGDSSRVDKVDARGVATTDLTPSTHRCLGKLRPHFPVFIPSDDHWPLLDLFIVSRMMVPSATCQHCRLHRPARGE